MPFTIEQRSKIVKFYLETKSLVQTQREYCKHFGVKEAPSVTSIKKIVQKFEVHGTCHNRNKGNSGRRVSACTELNIDTVRESTVRSPKKSIRRRSSELGLTKSTIQRILKQDLNLRGLFKKYPTFLYKAHNTINFASFIQSPSKYSPWWFTHLSQRFCHFSKHFINSSPGML